MSMTASIGPPKGPSARILLTAGICAALMVMAWLSARTGYAPALVNSLGLLAAIGGLVLPPRMAAIVGVLAVGLAGSYYLASQHTGQDAVRLTNAIAGAGIGLSASILRGRAVSRYRFLQEQEAALIRGVVDGVALMDAEGRVQISNPALQAFAPGLQANDRLHDLLHHRDADGSPCEAACPLAGGGATRGWVVGSTVGRTDRAVPIVYQVTAAAAGTWAVTLRDRSDQLLVERALRRSWEADAQAREARLVVEEFGARLRPVAPDLEGVELDVWSQPAGTGPTGGDLADISRLPDGRLLLVVVDAIGHSIASVRDAWKVLYVCRSYLMVGAPLSEVITRTAEALANEPQPPSATLVIAVMDTNSGSVELVGGSHPPPLLIRRGGATEWLEVPGRGLGMPDPGSDRVVTTRLMEGDSLLLYTDGLIEAERDVIRGMGLLRAAAEAIRADPPEGWARGLVERMLPEGQAPDDTVALLARRTRRLR